ncbi:MFS transporter [Nocardioides sp. AE5]|uniref:MFS transporter n=1 Tax=Nocardioides sp. AE5 TaxID=2962573 RepID=UPI002881704A|nr:MFS transporter [Nocardioides sp. AE5]MDT0203418.1 MFS transporter [Nocardioides sp. AE5]
MTTYHLPVSSRTPDQLTSRGRWAALAVLMLPVLLVSIDNTALSFAVPALSRSLAPSGNQLLWIIDVYPLVLAALLVTMGSLGDRIGRRRILLLGGVGFAAVSVLAAFAPSAGWLVAARALLGVFGAMLMPATISLIRNIFTDAAERRTAIAIWMAGFSGGAALGPMVGGWLLQHFWWGSIFLIAVPVLVPLLVLAPRLLPESRDPDPGPVDILGIALVSLALAAVVYGIKAFATHGLDQVTVAAAIAGVGAGVLFVRRMLTRRNPMLDVRLFANPVFSVSLVVNLVSVFALVGFIYFLTQHLQLIAGHSPLDAAVMMIPGLVVTVALGLGAVPMVHRFGAVPVMVGGVLLNAFGYVVVSALGHTGSGIALLVGFVLVCAGVGMSETVSNDLALGAVPPAKAGAASAVSETAYEVGAVLGTAVLGSLLNLAYRQGVQVPVTVDPELAEQARATLGAAHEVAESLPSAAADALLASAAHAFDSGVTVTAAIAGALSFAVAIAAHRILRGRI